MPTRRKPSGLCRGPAWTRWSHKLLSSHGCQDSHTSRHCTQSWCLSRLWTVHETTRRESHQHLFLPLTSSASPCRKRHHHLFGAGGHHVKTGLLQLSVGRPSPIDTPATSKSPARCHTVHLRRSISRTHHYPSARAALASGSLKNWIHAVLDDVQCTQWSLPFVPLRHVAAGSYSITSTSSALRRLVKLRQAATSDKIRRTGVFTFWSSGMESTSRAHQTTVVSLCFQART